jgi:hypothetical protein
MGESHKQKGVPSICLHEQSEQVIFH